MINLLKHCCAVSLITLCLNSCGTHEPSPSAEVIKSDSSVQSNGPTEAEIQQALIKGLAVKISLNCNAPKNALLESLKSVKYKAGTVTFVDARAQGYKVYRIAGTIYWPYMNKAKGLDPSAGEPIASAMSSDPSDNLLRTGDKWAFTGFGPWSDLLSFAVDHGCTSVN